MAETANKVRAPELPDELEWVNSNFAPSIAASKGKVVLLYFWTYSNINSLNMLPEIRAMENKFENGLVVIGIHCPKFPHEEKSANVLKTINRLFIRHPVATDKEYSVWHAYGVNAWPSVAVVDAEGYLRQVYRGDDCIRHIDRQIGELLNEAANQNIRNYGRVRTERKPESKSTLKFPSAVVAARGMLYVADSANNRILEIKESGRVVRVFGSGNPGFWDGTLNNAGFSLPRDLAVYENYIYVADTGNHAIRRINLFNGEIETLVGNGKPGRMVVRAQREMREVSLVSPVSLTIQGPDLYITVAGMNQIWKMDLKAGTIGWFSGTGQAWIVDGEATQAAFAHPMGISACDPFLYVADADGSAIREIRCQSGHVQTRMGKGVYMYGDEDGPGGRALLQYPMDVKIRKFDLKSGELRTPDFNYEFSEPFGLTFHEGTLWVANTNAHEIVRVDTISRHCDRLEIVETSF
jgi:thiol-disulfide isomerase/thioredoxin